MAFKPSNMVIAKSSAFSRARVLAALDLQPNHPEAEKLLKQVQDQINRDLLHIGPGACHFELSSAPNEGWLAVTAIEESRYDHYQSKLREILPKEKVEEIVLRAIQTVRDA